MTVPTTPTVSPPVGDDLLIQTLLTDANGQFGFTYDQILVFVITNPAEFVPATTAGPEMSLFMLRIYNILGDPLAMLK